MDRDGGIGYGEFVSCKNMGIIKEYCLDLKFEIECKNSKNVNLFWLSFYYRKNTVQSVTLQQMSFTKYLIGFGKMVFLVFISLNIVFPYLLGNGGLIMMNSLITVLMGVEVQFVFVLSFIYYTQQSMKFAYASAKSVGEEQKDGQVSMEKSKFEGKSLGSPLGSIHSFLSPHHSRQYQKKLALRVKKLMSL